MHTMQQLQLQQQQQQQQQPVQLGQEHVYGMSSNVFF